MFAANIRLLHSIVNNIPIKIHSKTVPFLPFGFSCLFSCLECLPFHPHSATLCVPVPKGVKGVKKGFARPLQPSARDTCQPLQPSARDTCQHLRQTPVAICGRCLTWSAADGEGGLRQMLEPLCRRCPRLLVRLC